VCGILGFRSFSFAFFQNLVFCFFLYFKLLLFFLPNEQSQLGVKLVDITLRAGIFFFISGNITEQTHRNTNRFFLVKVVASFVF